MAKQTNLNIRTDVDIKTTAEKIFEQLGLNMSTAVNIFLRQVIRNGGLPFKVELDTPNEVTVAAIKDAENGENLFGPFDNTESLMEALDA